MEDKRLMRCERLPLSSSPDTPPTLTPLALSTASAHPSAKEANRALEMALAAKSFTRRTGNNLRSRDLGMAAGGQMQNGTCNGTYNLPESMEGGGS